MTGKHEITENGTWTLWNILKIVVICILIIALVIVMIFVSRWFIVNWKNQPIREAQAVATTEETAVAVETTAQERSITEITKETSSASVAEGELPAFYETEGGIPYEGTSWNVDVAPNEIEVFTGGPCEINGVKLPGGTNPDRGSVVILLPSSQVIHYTIKGVISGSNWHGAIDFVDKVPQEKDWKALVNDRVQAMSVEPNGTLGKGCKVVDVLVVQGTNVVFQQTYENKGESIASETTKETSSTSVAEVSETAEETSSTGKLPDFHGAEGGIPYEGTSWNVDVAPNEIEVFTGGPCEINGVKLPGGTNPDRGSVVILLPSKAVIHYVISGVINKSNWHGAIDFVDKVPQEKDWKLLVNDRVQAMFVEPNGSLGKGCKIVDVVVVQGTSVVFQETYQK
jgi:hypothetical protein